MTKFAAVILFLIGCLSSGCSQHTYLSQRLTTDRQVFPDKVAICGVELRQGLLVPSELVENLNAKLENFVTTTVKAKTISITSSDNCLEQRQDASHLIRVLLQDFRERKGGELGAVEPAKVAVTIQLIDASDLSLVWRSHYERTDMPVSDNVLLLGEKMQEGFEFKSAEYLLDRAVVESINALAVAVERPI
jgi:hypothetical protein